MSGANTADLVPAVTEGIRAKPLGRGVEGERRQGGEEHFGVVNLQGRVQTAGVLALQRPARGPELGVEADAQELDVFGIFGEVSRRLHVAIDGQEACHPAHIAGDLLGDLAGDDAGDLPLYLRLDNRLRRAGRNLRRDRGGDLLSDGLGNKRGNRLRQRLSRHGSGRTHRRRRKEAVRYPLHRARAPAQEGKAAVIVDDEETEFGVVELLGEVAHRDSPLTGVFGFAVCPAEYVQEMGVEYRLRSLGKGHQSARRRGTGNPETLQIGVDRLSEAASQRLVTESRHRRGWPPSRARLSSRPRRRSRSSRSSCPAGRSRSSPTSPGRSPRA